MTSLFLLWMNQRLDHQRILAINFYIINNLLILFKRNVVSRSVNFLLSIVLKNVRLKHNFNNFNLVLLDLEQQKYNYNAFIVIPIPKTRFISHYTWNCNFILVIPKWCCVAPATNNSAQASWNRLGN